MNEDLQSSLKNTEVRKSGGSQGKLAVIRHQKAFTCLSIGQYSGPTLHTCVPSAFDADPPDTEHNSHHSL